MENDAESYDVNNVREKRFDVEAPCIVKTVIGRSCFFHHRNSAAVLNFGDSQIKLTGKVCRDFFSRISLTPRLLCCFKDQFPVSLQFD